MSHIFIALPLPFEIKQVLKEQKKSITAMSSFQKWLHPDDYHLTLVFLGEVSTDQMPHIPPILQKIAEEFPAFSLTLHQWGSFGNPAQPRIFWAGVRDCNTLERLQSRVQEAIEPLGFPLDIRPYRPHITIARKAERKDFTLERLQRSSALPKISWNVTEFALYQTNPLTIPRYHPLNSFVFRGSN